MTTDPRRGESVQPDPRDLRGEADPALDPHQDDVYGHVMPDVENPGIYRVDAEDGFISVDDERLPHT